MSNLLQYQGGDIVSEADLLSTRKVVNEGNADRYPAVTIGDDVSQAEILSPRDSIREQIPARSAAHEQQNAQSVDDAPKDPAQVQEDDTPIQINESHVTKNRDTEAALNILERSLSEAGQAACGDAEASSRSGTMRNNEGGEIVKVHDEEAVQLNKGLMQDEQAADLSRATPETIIAKCYACDSEAKMTCNSPTGCKNQACDQHAILDTERKTRHCSECSMQNPQVVILDNQESTFPQPAKSKRWLFGLLTVAFLVGLIAVIAGTAQDKDTDTESFRFSNVDVRQALAGFYLQENVPKAEMKVMNDFRMRCIPPPPLSDFKERTLIHVSTDKPFYRPGEIVFIESFFIDAISKKPIFARQDTLYPQHRFESYSYLTVQGQATIYDSKDNKVHSFETSKLYNGTVVWNSWRIPSDKSGGEYKIQVSSYYNQVPDSFRKIRIGAFSNPTLFVTLDFEKNVYSPGDTVIGKIKVRKPDGELLPQGSSIAFSVSSGESEQNIKLNGQGETTINFKIPDSITMKVLTVSLKTYLGYSQENKSASPQVSAHSVPLIDDEFSIDFFPESSEKLIESITNRVYFQAMTKPDKGVVRHVEFFKASIREESSSINQVLSEVAHIHNGRGFFDVAPSTGTTYSLEVMRTSTSKPKKFPLPQIDDNAFINFILQKRVFNSADDSISVSLATNRKFKEAKVQVSIMNKENIIVDKNFTFTKENGRSFPTIEFPMATIYKEAKNGGVFILKARSIKVDDKNVTTFSDDVKLERLIFVYPQESLEVVVTTDQQDYQPGDLVKMKISVDKPKDLNATEIIYASIKVSDLSSFLKVESFNQGPSLQQMVYLEKEIQQLNMEIDEFKYSDEFLFQRNDTMLDVLLGCQGWRQFKLDDLKTLRSKINGMDDKENQKHIYNYLLGQKSQLYYYNERGGMDGMIMEAMPMAAMADEAPAPRIQRMAMRGGEQKMMMKNLGGAAAPKDKKPAGVATEKDEGEDEFKKLALQKILDSRRYTHPRRQDFDRFGKREDFTQTILFNSALGLQEDPEDPTKLIVYQNFFLNEQVSQFQIQVNAFSSEGKYGYEKRMLASSKLMYAQYELPTTFVQGDVLSIPVTIFSNIGAAVDAEVEFIETRDGEEFKTDLASMSVDTKGNAQVSYKIDTNGEPFQNLSLAVKVTRNNDEVVDYVEKKAKVVLDGFEQQVAYPGVIGISSTPSDLQSSVTKTITLPSTMVGEPQFRMLLSSTTFDSILGAIKSLIRNPSGCFEQTSSTTYPMVMALQLLKEIRKQFDVRGDKDSLKAVDEMIADIKEKLEAGYKKLISFETSSKGYEWFGKAPGHEALTGYGIKQFQEMKDVVSFVDDSAIKRNSDWLMSRRKSDGSGKFQRNQKALDTFGRASDDVTDAYLLWVLTSVKGYDESNLSEELSNLEGIADRSNDPYVLSLSAGTFVNVGKLDLADEIAARTSKMQNSTSGAVDGAITSITASRGNNLLVETTSLAVINWLDINSSKYSDNIEPAVGFLMNSVKDGGRYGSTQATVLCLQALVKYAKIFGGLKGSGKFVLSVDGDEVSSLEFDEKAQMLNNLDFSHELNRYYKDNQPSGPFKVGISITNYQFNAKKQGFRLSYLLETVFVDKLPKSPENPAIKFSLTDDITLAGASKSIGKIQKQYLIIDNASGKAQGMVVATVSVPSCMIVEQAQLELLKNSGKVDQYEVSADNTLITFYWTYLKEAEQKKIALSRVVKFGGKDATCLARASKAFLYYDDDNEIWVK